MAYDRKTFFYYTGRAASLLFALGCGFTVAGAALPYVPVWACASVFACTTYMNWRLMSLKVSDLFEQFFSLDFFKNFFAYSVWAGGDRPKEWPSKEASLVGDPGDEEEIDWEERQLSFWHKLFIGVGLILSVLTYGILAAFTLQATVGTLTALAASFTFLAPFSALFPAIGIIFSVVSALILSIYTFNEISLLTRNGKWLDELKNLWNEPADTETQKLSKGLRIFLRVILFPLAFFGVFMTMQASKTKLDTWVSSTVGFIGIAIGSVVDFYFYIDPYIKVETFLKRCPNLLEHLIKMSFVRMLTCEGKERQTMWKEGHEAWAWFFYRTAQVANAVANGFIAVVGFMTVGFSFLPLVSMSPLVVHVLGWAAGITAGLNSFVVLINGDGDIDEYGNNTKPEEEPTNGPFVYAGYLSCLALLVFFPTLPLIVQILAGTCLVFGALDVVLDYITGGHSSLLYTPPSGSRQGRISPFEPSKLSSPSPRQGSDDEEQLSSDSETYGLPLFMELGVGKVDGRLSPGSP